MQQRMMWIESFFETSTVRIFDKYPPIGDRRLTVTLYYIRDRFARGSSLLFRSSRFGLL